MDNLYVNQPVMNFRILVSEARQMSVLLLAWGEDLVADIRKIKIRKINNGKNFNKIVFVIEVHASKAIVHIEINAVCII